MSLACALSRRDSRMLENKKNYRVQVQECMYSFMKKIFLNYSSASSQHRWVSPKARQSDFHCVWTTKQILMWLINYVKLESMSLSYIYCWTFCYIYFLIIQSFCMTKRFICCCLQLHLHHNMHEIRLTLISYATNSLFLNQIDPHMPQILSLSLSLF